jgi:CHAT domain-containing protein
LSVATVLRRAEGRPPGGLVVLSACSSDVTVREYDEALTLAAAFLGAGATGVLGAA